MPKGNFNKGPWPSASKYEESRGKVKKVTKTKSGSKGEKVDQKGKGT